MKIHPISHKMVDVFLDINTFPTGYEPECWLRLQKRGNFWIQVAGIKVATWKFKQLLAELEQFLAKTSKGIS